MRVVRSDGSEQLDRLLPTELAIKISESPDTFEVVRTYTVLGWLRIPGPPVEATIALSIVFLAVEIIHVRQGPASLTAQRPWLVAFAFGMLHGLGFAGALACGRRSGRGKCRLISSAAWRASG